MTSENKQTLYLIALMIVLLAACFVVEFYLDIKEQQAIEAINTNNGEY